jgi:alkanesulfonate monooxygenase SsuD/methylene tetrahydromethanopterin reductase-like flavin-dependent oxidoreductase (luciferase family)
MRARSAQLGFRRFHVPSGPKRQRRRLFRRGGVHAENGKHDDQADSTAQFLDWFKMPFPGQNIFGLYRRDAEAAERGRKPDPPAAAASFDGRIFAVASSEDSVLSAAKLGAHMVMFADRPWDMRLPVIERGRELHRQFHGTTVPQVMLTEFVVCGPNLAACEEEARQYQGKFVESNFYHYEFLGEHFKTVKGYDAYQQKAEIARKGGLEGAVAGFMKAASWGTPDKILRGLEERRELLGDFELNVAFRFGGTPYDVCERGLRLFAKEVLPVLKAQPAPKVRDAAE